MSNQNPQGNMLFYKDYPILRNSNIIYYGDMSDEYIVMLQILDADKEDDLNVSGKVSVQLLRTDLSLDFKDRVVKQTQKQGIYTALDISYIWLNKALTGKN